LKNAPERNCRAGFHRDLFKVIHYCGDMMSDVLLPLAQKLVYYMALYKVRTTLDSLQGEFGMDESLYRDAGPLHVNIGMAVTLLKRILAREKQLEDRIKRVQRRAAAKPEKKPLSKKKRRR
jgi:hypothetical protein